jgi:hypothetical protein
LRSIDTQSGLEDLGVIVTAYALAVVCRFLGAASYAIEKCISSVHDVLGAESIRRARGHRFPQHVSSRQLRNAKTHSNLRRLSTLSRTWRSQQNQSHQLSPLAINFLPYHCIGYELPSVTLDPPDCAHSIFPAQDPYGVQGNVGAAPLYPSHVKIN